MATLDFLSNALITKIRLVLLGSLVILSFFTISGVGTMTSKFSVCPLFSAKHWSKGVCDFAIAVAVVLQLVYCTFRFVPALLLFLGKMRAGAIFFDHGVQRCYILWELNFTIVVFVTAALLSIGVSNTCSSQIFWEGHNSCAQTSWYTAMQVAQAGAWLSTIAFVPLLVLDSLALQRMNDLEVMNEPPKVIFTASGPSAGQVKSAPSQGIVNQVYPVEDVDASSLNQPPV